MGNKKLLPTKYCISFMVRRGWVGFGRGRIKVSLQKFYTNLNNFFLFQNLIRKEYLTLNMYI
jgi:hypothetical protein